MKRYDNNETYVKRFRLRNLARCRAAYQKDDPERDSTLLEKVMVQIQNMLSESRIQWTDFDGSEDLES